MSSSSAGFDDRFLRAAAGCLAVAPEMGNRRVDPAGLKPKHLTQLVQQ